MDYFIIEKLKTYYSTHVYFSNLIGQVSERVSAFFYVLDTIVTNGKVNQTVKQQQTDALITRITCSPG